MKEQRTLLSWGQVSDRVRHLGIAPHSKIFGIPRGGNYIAAICSGIGMKVVTDPAEADVFVDDIIDSGRTKQKWQVKYDYRPFVAPVDKVWNEKDRALGWVIFPWENQNHLADAQDTITRVLEMIGEDPRREGLVETPKRVVSSWKEIFAGYSVDPSKILKTTFQKDGYDQMVILREIEFHSFCEHHMLPFSGTATVAYIPKEKVVGLSKLARLVDCYAKRLQIQERLTQQIADTIQSVLDPIGAGVILQAKHHCMLCRGVGKQGSSMVTCAITGDFRKPEVRAEFLQLAKA